MIPPIQKQLAQMQLKKFCDTRIPEHVKDLQKCIDVIDTDPLCTFWG